MKKKLINFIINNPKKILFFFLLITIISGIGLYKIKLDTDIRNLIPESLPSKKIFNTLVKNFGDPDFLMIAIGNKKKDVFNLKTIKKIYKITKELENFDGLEKVISIANLKDISADNNGFVINNMLDEEPVTEADVLTLKKRFMKNNDYKKMFISKYEHFSVIIGILYSDTDEDIVYKFLEKVKKNMRDLKELLLAGCLL